MELSRILKAQPCYCCHHLENAHCANCELGENLWLCLVCGNLGCGRQQFGGTGGNGHGLAHFDATGHGVACKLGTITPEGTAGNDLISEKA